MSYRIESVPVLHCDEDGCELTVTGELGGEVAPLRSYAESIGWTHTPYGRDYCVDHRRLDHRR